MSITAEARQEVESLLQRGQKVKAVKYLCDTFNVSLQEAKALVEAVEAERKPKLAPQAQYQNDDSSSTLLSGSLKDEVVSLLLANKKIEAVRRVKDELNTGLKEALQLVEEVDRNTNPNYRSVSIRKGCLGGGFALGALVFGFVGLVFVAIAGASYYFQQQTIENSEKITGVVTDFHYGSKNGSSPIITYEWNGEKRQYHSNTYSSPPAYDLHEEVTMFVNRDNPDDVVVDTFSDRWFLIIIFGGMGSVFVLICVLFFFVGRKF